MKEFKINKIFLMRKGGFFDKKLWPSNSKWLVSKHSLK